MRLPFAKMSGAGNDFVLIDRRQARGSIRFRDLARRLCDRRGGVGADGLLVVDGKTLRLGYWNADGSEAFCGNGSRCAAWWMYAQGLTGGKRAFKLRTSAGPLRARVTGRETVAIRMPEPRSIRLGLKVKALGKTHTVHSLNTGVPHAVVVVRDLDAFPVFETGRALRRHKAFAPAGTNADFIAWKGKTLLVRTYERGVEDETLACGTGVAASALTAYLLGKSTPPVSVKVRGGATLNVSFKPLGGVSFTEVWLEGPAQVVYTGELA